jgi:arylsulfatase A-like enzyme
MEMYRKLRKILKYQCAVVLLFLFICDGSHAQKSGTPLGRPNILWICTDQQRWNTIGALGNEHVLTPNIDKLVENGVAFTRAYCQSPVCTPSRSSFLTGMYSSTLRNSINGGAHWPVTAPPLITKTLDENGYVCGLSGKLHLSAAHGRVEQRPDDGYREFYWSHHPWNSWPEGHDYMNWLEAQGLSYDSMYDKHGFIPAEFHQTKWCTDRAIEFIKGNKELPWLFSLNIFDPHNPYDPPQKYLDRYNVDEMPGPYFRPSDIAFQKTLDFAYFQTESQNPDSFNAKLLQAKYWAQIDQIDENLGRLFQVLKDLGEWDNTIIIFTSDHGDMVGDHGFQKKGCRFYDGLVRVPLIFHWPKGYVQEIKSEALVELVDIYPTLMEAVGLPAGKKIQGRSLTSILKGEANPNQHRQYVRSEYYDALDKEPADFATMIQGERYKLVVYHGHDLGELYDMKSDPCEFNNLWDDPDYTKEKYRLMKTAFDQTAFSIDTGPERIGRY